MAKGSELKDTAYKRLKTVKILLDNSEWHIAAYIMGYVLECALKATICKTLRISEYPETHKHRDIPYFFKDHTFDKLYLLSGTSQEIFGPYGDLRAFDSWSQFTAWYPGDWVKMRYDEVDKQFDKVTSKNLYKYLYEDESSIIKTIEKNDLW
jgi:hypothetical protein